MTTRSVNSRLRNKQLFCFTGLPLAGKTHMASMLASRISNSMHISTGDIARSLITNQDQQQKMEETDLFPGETELRDILYKSVDNASASCVLVDGFPRTASQALFLAEMFNDIFPTVIDVSAGDLQTLAIRAKLRARDARDSDPAAFYKRVSLAMKNQLEVSAVLNSKMIPCYTIISTADEQSVLKQFSKIARIKL